MPGRVLIPDYITEAGKQYLRERGYEVIIGNGTDEETLCREIADCDAVLARTEHYTRRVLAAGKKLKVIGRHGVGTDNIDLKAATEFGIQVTNAPNANTNSVAEHTVALLFACARNLVQMDRVCRNGPWELRDQILGTEVMGKTLGVVGAGKIGQMVMHKASAGLGMKVIAYNHRPKPVPEGVRLVTDLRDVFQEADFVSVHLPAVPETQNCMGKSLFRLMKPSAFFINTARGKIVNEQDLYRALSEHWIRGAALDVFQQEPVSPDNPLFSLENLIVTPHYGAQTDYARDHMGLDAARGIDEVLSGKKPTWPVNHLL